MSGRRAKNVRPSSGAETLAPVDRSILAVLRENARLPNNAIAARVGVAPSTCLARIRGLEERGVILGYHADLDPGILGGAIQAMIAVRLRAGARHQLRAFTDQVVAQPEVVDAYFLGGQDDFMLHVAVPDVETLRTFVLEQLSANSQVAATQTNLIFEHVRGPARAVAQP
ncbi:Lrp/AsnC family transcriptional regulator [Microlunatus ginsengisoli]|uniref:Lrp/AsnC family transcriptional regulator n=1 Tax=Microlunatus ginsengisoli TaxID=363863 RepID=A0ABP6ZQ76_9ACTN